MLSLFRSFALAQRYAPLLSMSDAELARRGLTRDGLKAEFLAAHDVTEAIPSAADRRAPVSGLPA